MVRCLVLAIGAAGGVFAAPAAASAHALHAKVTVAETVRVDVYYDDETPAEFADVTITDASGTVVLTGKADERGVWTFPRPAPGTYLLTAKSVGHVVKREFPVEGESAEPVVYTGWRPNTAVALAGGLALLLGISALSWFLRHRRRG